MGDFRASLYRTYVSTYKGEKSQVWDSRGLAPYWSWCGYRYLPILAGVSRADHVLELGCGPGYLLEFLQRQGFSHVEGVDISEEQVALARGRGLDARVGDLFEVLRDLKDVSVIIAVDVFEHLTRDELLRLAPLLSEALRPGGRLLVQTANGEGLFPGGVIYGDLTHVTVLTPRSLAQLLRPFGFRDFAFYETGPVPLAFRGRINFTLWRVIKLAANMVRRIEAGKTQAIWTENFVCSATRA